MKYHRVDIRFAYPPIEIVNGQPKDSFRVPIMVTDSELPILLGILDRTRVGNHHGYVRVDGKVVR